MLTSARNQFPGEVVEVRTGAVNDEIVIQLPGGQQIVATVTHESVAGMGLAKGRQAVAMVKASSVIVMVDVDVGKVSARNAISGSVSTLTKGAVNAEVTIAAASGPAVCAIITNASVDRLGLAIGKPAVAIFKASSVIIGVDG